MAGNQKIIGIFKRQGLWALMLAAYFALRLANLRAMPVFSDESIYARWAQLIDRDPWRNLFVSMTDAKLPLHYWLMAATRFLSSDPITAGRALSVVTGAVALLIVPLLCAELAELQGAARDRGPGLFAFLAAGLLITSPFVALQQRMILAEALLIPEALLIAALSLRLARRIRASEPTLKTAVALGLVWAATLLTKQNFSYLLWLLPPAAFVAGVRKGGWRRNGRRFLEHFALASALGLVFFVPALLTCDWLPLTTRLFYKPVFYTHASIAGNVARLLSPRSNGTPQWWPYNPGRPLEDGWLYAYLTPPVFLFLMVGFLWMCRGAPRMMVFLGLWAAGLLVPLVVSSGVFFPRYAILGTLPLLLIVAWSAADRVRRLRERSRGGVAALATVGLMVALLAWPTWVTAWTAADPLAPTLVLSDLHQFRTELYAGDATEAAIGFLEGQARQHPITIITGSWLGVPNEMVWATLSDNHNVQLYWHPFQKHVDGRAETVPLLPLKGRPSTFALGQEVWTTEPAAVTLDANRPTYFLMPAVYDDINEDWNTFGTSELPAGSELIAVFPNLVNPVTHATEAELRLWRIGLTNPALPAVTNPAVSHP